MKYGANSFIWASPFSTAQSISLLTKVKVLGFDAIEIACEDPALVDVRTLKDALKGVGLQGIICGAFGPDRDLSSADPAVSQNAETYIRWMVDAAAEIGSPVVIGPLYASVGKAHPDTEAGARAEWERSISRMRPLAEYAGAHGVKLAIEPLNRFETDLINVAQQALEYCDAVGSPHLGLHLDTFHMHIEESNSAAAIRAAGPRLFHLHASENDRGVPGAGQVAWRAIFDALRDIAYEGVVGIESFTPEVKSIARAVCIWRKLAPDQDTIAREGLAFLRSLDTPEDTTWSTRP